MRMMDRSRRGLGSLVGGVGMVALALGVPAASSAAAQEGYPGYDEYPGEPGGVVERSRAGGLPATARFRGQSRHDTAGQIATDDRTVHGSGFRDADEVVLARADAFPDSLAGVFVAGAAHAPILLVESAGPIESHTKRALEVIDPETVTVLGGTSAISDQGAADAAAIGTQTSTVERLAGPTRFETAAALAGVADVAEHRRPGDEAKRTAFLATGLAFADALAAGQLSFRGHPTLLTTPDELHDATARAIAEHDIEHVIILGGTRAVSASVQTQVEAQGVTTDRVGDADRVGTATQVAQLAVEEFDVVAEHVNVASAATFADALAMGPHAGREHEREAELFFPRDTGVLVLSRGATSLDGVGGNDAQPSAFLEAHACDTTSLHLAGGTAAMSHELEDAIRRHSACPGQPGPVDALELTPETETSLEGETHRITATAVDEDGRVTEAGDDRRVRFEVYADDGATFPAEDRDPPVDTTVLTDGATEFAYEGPAVEAGTEQREVVVACLVDEGDDELADDEPHCTANDGESETEEADDLALRDDRLADEVHHRWVAVEDVDAGSISGTVTHLDGEAIAGASVRIANGSDKTVVSGDDGGYQSGPLLPGTYTIAVRSHDCDEEPLTVEVEPGEDLHGEDFTRCAEIADT